MHLCRSSVVAAALLCGMLTACAGPPTKLVGAWQLSDYTPTGYQKVLVIGLSSEGGRRRIFEDAFCYQLQQRGVTAIASYTLIPEDGKVPNERLEAAIRESGAQGVLTTRLIGTNTNVDYNDTHYQAIPVYYDSFYGYYGNAFVYAQVPMASTTTVVTLESDMFDGTKLKMIWSGTTQTTNPTSLNQEMAGFAKIVIDEMAKRGLLAVKP
jgi:hypothetical protein